MYVTYCRSLPLMILIDKSLLLEIFLTYTETMTTTTIMAIASMTQTRITAIKEELPSPPPPPFLAGVVLIVESTATSRSSRSPAATVGE